MEKKKKLIFFSSNMNIGGMEKALLILLNELAKKDYNVTLVLENKSGVLLDELYSDISVKEYRVSKCRFVLLRKVINLVHRTLWSLVNYHKYDFSCNYSTYSVLGSRLAEIASSNSSLYVHSDYYSLFSGDTEKIKEFFVQQGIAKLRQIIFVANEAKDPISKIFPEFSEKFCVISNLIDYNHILRSSLGEVAVNKTDGKELMMFVGRLEEVSKRLSRLLESFKNVLSFSSDYELWIIGDGNDRELCYNLIKEYGLDGNVKMLGEVLNPYPYIKMADCVVMSSDFEGYPVIYNECMVLNIPIITTVAVSDSYVDSNNYSVIVEKEPFSIAQAIVNKDYKRINFENVDFHAINNSRLKALEKLICGRAF